MHMAKNKSIFPPPNRTFGAVSRALVHIADVVLELVGALCGLDVLLDLLVPCTHPGRSVCPVRGDRSRESRHEGACKAGAHL